MSRPSYLFLVLTVALATTVAATPPASAQYTCQSVATRNELDPNGALFSNRFRAVSGVNSSGDMMFVARPIGLKDQLYLYENGGTSSVIAVGGGPAVLPGATFTASAFDFLSINDGGDLGFWGNLVSQGEAVYGRPNGGGLAVVAATTQPADGGGVYATFPKVAEVNTGGVIAYLATTTSGGPSTAVYTYDIPGGGPDTKVVEAGDLTTSGREICEILDLDFGDGGEIALLAVTKVLCSNAVETPLDTVIHVSGGGTITEVAKVNDATPIGGTTFGSFKLSPQVNSSGNVLFETKLSGLISSQAVFAWDGIVSSPVVVQGDFSPEAGGSYRKFSDIGYANTGEAFVKAKFKGSGAKDAIVRLDPPASTSVVTKDDAPPAPYAPGAFYRKMGKLISVSKDGSKVGFIPKVKDAVLPKSKVGAVLCVE